MRAGGLVQARGGGQASDAAICSGGNQLEQKQPAQQCPRHGHLGLQPANLLTRTRTFNRTASVDGSPGCPTRGIHAG